MQGQIVKKVSVRDKRLTVNSQSEMGLSKVSVRPILRKVDDIISRTKAKALIMAKQCPWVEVTSHLQGHKNI